MAYDFTVASAGELESLAWIAARYDYARMLEVAIDNAKPDEFDEEKGPFPVTFDLSEPDVWDFKAAVETEDGWLPCLGGRLEEEVNQLLGRIV